ncbi:MAG: pyruvate, phosphate dikinase [Planctomycetes bacterium]|nr:pyruvate, phosphate dikinase [Planctomycetota bacterium]
MSRKWVYAFVEGQTSWKSLLGGKGANLAEMTNLGLPIPPGFTITTEACNAYLEGGNSFPEGLWDQVLVAMKAIEGEKGFGSTEQPLLVSVRSGAKFSMPGMMDTVLNLGLNRETAVTLGRLMGNERFAMDSLRRLIQLYAKIVMDVSSHEFDNALMDACADAGVAEETELDAQQLEAVTERYRRIVKDATGQEFPEDPYEQLRLAIAAVFRSWNGRRARDYRRMEGIADDLGTAVNIQAMVFGNMGEDSGTGVAFTRDPSTGAPGLFGEYLLNAQGEDVVAGVRTPAPISTLEESMPKVYEQFLGYAQKLEDHFLDMQDMEFTIERGTLYMLQTRNGKRTGASAVKIAVDMVAEGKISKQQAVARVDAEALDQLLHPMIDPSATPTSLAKGLPASPGAAAGEIVFDPDEAEDLAREGKAVLLVRTETAPEDFHGMVAANGILTSRGGMTSHAAVVARGMGKCCVCGAGEVRVDYQTQKVSIGGREFERGAWFTLDGSTGHVYEGQVKTLEPELAGEFQTLMEWADSFRTTTVRTNCDDPEAAVTARKFGAEGIGLCRTEHMFFQDDRIKAMREMIVADTVEERERALAKLEPLQEQDFLGIFKAMDGLPVTIRTLDPPLHEFLPHEDAEIVALAKELDIAAAALRSRITTLREANPMLGFRGCRLGNIYPEITRTQARAIIRAACTAQTQGIEVLPEIMIPLVSDVRELRVQTDLVRTAANEVMEETGVTVEYMVGTMIELPRAALLADEIAEIAEFFSFGTNDLTQTTYGLSRDDSGTFLPQYLQHRWFDNDPFQVLDQHGVGKLVQMGTQLGRGTRPDLKVGICGEHGGEPSSVRFCIRTGLDYVSCSPYRVPIARLAAAQEAIAQATQAEDGASGNDEAGPVANAMEAGP